MSSAHRHGDHDHAGHDHAGHDHAGHDHAGHGDADRDHAAFPAPGHDHGACADALVERAEARCRDSGARLTTQRRAVLDALARSHKPIGAYEIIEALSANGPPPAPISVYRALAFLTEQGLVHRIERLNAFVACAGTHGETNPLVFMICDSCGQVGELAAAAVGIDLTRLTAGTGFVPQSAAIEVTGLCRHCAAAKKTETQAVA
ncbi:Fur family transcriptional regulator [Segnochrobactrum spirostomi]|uniref:Fur family transcriptional regulator n=1 Tax=Segnochrobactrum spirostomi TaxID=2608987 RepID=UPI0028B1C9EE|nr:transcriptional repressor [Segnochrobactrum spirostomi]